MKGRKALERKSPKKNAKHGLRPRQQAWDSLSSNDKQGTKRPGSLNK